MDDELDEPYPVDEHRLEALALERGVAVETKYEQRGVIWCCWIYVGGHLKCNCLSAGTKQRAFERAMDEMEGEIASRKSPAWRLTGLPDRLY